MYTKTSQLEALKGFSTIELLITFALGIVFLSAAIMVSFNDSSTFRQTNLESGQSSTLDATLDSSALSTTSNTIGGIVAAFSKNWNASVVTTNDSTYTTTPTITDLSSCFKAIDVTTTWNTIGRNGRAISLSTGLGNLDIAKALGGDCDPLPSSESWKKPRIFSRHNFNPGKPISIDVLNRFAYITDDKGKLQIYNATNDTLGNTANFSITPYQDAGGKQLNAVDVAKVGSGRYAFVTRNEASGQFQVINVTTPGSYTASPVKTLAGTTPPSGSFPQGWRVFYYANKAYVTTRETTGYEFHIFDVSTPLNPSEIGTGMEINGTINDLFVSDIAIGNTTYKLAFLATDRSANEVMVLNVTNPSSLSQISTIDIPTTSDALSIRMLGNKLYVGRQNTTGNGNPELIVYNITYGQSGSAPTVSFTQVGNGGETGADVTYMRVTNQLAFVGNPSPTVEFRVWDISKPATNVTRIDTSPLSVSNKIFGLDYESPYVYAISQANDSLQIIYSAP